MEGEILLDTETAANLFSVHPRTLRRLVERGQIPVHRLGREYRFHVAEILEHTRQPHARVEAPRPAA